jgi:hypothetical protein
MLGLRLGGSGMTAAPITPPLPVHLQAVAEGWRRIFLAELRALAGPATTVQSPPGPNRRPQVSKRPKGLGDG